MSGIVIPIFCLRTWTFSGLKVGAGNAQEFCMLRDLPVAGYRELIVVVRVHALAMTNAASKIDVRVVESAPTPEDPSIEWIGDELAVGRVISTSGAPSLQLGETSSFGGFVSVYVKGTQGSAGSSVQATLSADLVLKE